MATKKQPLKKAAKPSKPAKSTPSKKPVAAKKATKQAPKKAVAKKVAAPVKKAAPKKAAPPPKPVKGISAAPKKAVPAVKKTAPTKAVKGAEPVKKAEVVAKTHEEIKPAIKPLTKPVAKKEPAKPIVIPKTSTTKAVKYEPEFTRSVLDKQTQESAGPTQRYSDIELAEFRELINRKLDTAKKELAYLQGLITRKDESGDMEDGRYMTMEDGSMSMEREQLSQMASRQIQFIDHLEKAIMRIENKTYGICRVTGKLIDKARLKAVPHATLSIEAKQMMNK